MIVSLIEPAGILRLQISLQASIRQCREILEVQIYRVIYASGAIGSE